MSVVYPEGPFTIYHVIDEKVGCTDDLTTRTRDNKRHYGKDIIVKVLEVVDDIDVADELENEWSIRLGYGPIPPEDRYKAVVSRLGAKRRGRKSWNSGKTGCYSEEYIESKRKSMKGNTRGLGNRFGIIFKDLISGITGTSTDIHQQLGIDIGTVYIYAKKGTPVNRKNGTIVHIVKVDQPAM